MTCSKCHGEPKSKPCGACGKLPPVIEIHNEECPVLFHTVEIEGKDEDNPPYIGQYKNVLLVYKGDGAKYLFNSDGIPSKLSIDLSDTDFDSLSNRPKYAGTEMTSQTDIPDVQETAAAAVKELDDTLATVAKSGSYTDLLNLPTFAAVATSGLYSDLIDTPNLAAVATSGSYTDLTDTPTVDTTYSASSDNAIANSTVTNSLDRNVLTDLIVDPTVSTTTLQLDTTKTNLSNPASTVTGNVSLPVASSTQAGIMNSSTYDAVTNNTTNINALLNGAVAISNLSANPTQADLTTAWQTATGLTALINRAVIYDVTNSKLWTYYTNTSTWYSASAGGGSVTVNQFTNSSLGTIMGSTVTGQVFAENDGTGSINGWDTLTSTVGDHTSKLATIAQGAEVNVQSNWTESDSNSDAYILNKPTIDSVLSTSSTNAIQNQAVATKFSDVAFIDSTIGTVSNNAYVGTNNIQDGAVTSDKVAFTVSDVAATMTVGNGSATNVTLKKIDLGNGLFMVTGIVYASATSVTAGSSTNIKLQFNNTFTALGGVVSVYQNTSVGSYTQYARIIPNTGSIDGYCYTPLSNQNIFWLNYFAIGTNS